MITTTTATTQQKQQQQQYNLEMHNLACIIVSFMSTSCHEHTKNPGRT